MNTVVGAFRCGHSDMQYTDETTDGPALQQHTVRLTSITTKASLVLHQVQSAYTGCDTTSGNTARIHGPLHGSLPGGNASTFDMSAYWASKDVRDRIVAVSVCCAGASWGNAVQRIRLLTMDGRELGSPSSR